MKRKGPEHSQQAPISAIIRKKGRCLKYQLFYDIRLQSYKGIIILKEFDECSCSLKSDHITCMYCTYNVSSN